jgi:polyhydroxyalkanoate synthase subunit PhaC
MAEMPTPPITPEEMNQVMAELAERSARLVADFAENPPPADMARNLDDLGIGQAFVALTQKLMADPQRLVETQTRAWQDYLALCQSTMKRFVGDAADPVKATPKGDTRFKGDIWQSTSSAPWPRRVTSTRRARARCCSSRGRSSTRSRPRTS